MISALGVGETAASLEQAWPIQQVPGQPGLHSKTLSHNIKPNSKQTNNPPPHTCDGTLGILVQDGRVFESFQRETSMRWGGGGGVGGGKGGGGEGRSLGVLIVVLHVPHVLEEKGCHIWLLSPLCLGC